MKKAARQPFCTWQVGAGLGAAGLAMHSWRHICCAQVTVPT